MPREQGVTEAFLDSNVLLRHLLGDHPEHSPAATAIIDKIERGDLRAHLADTVVFETVFTLERSYRRSKEDIRTALEPILELPGMALPHKRRMQETFDLYVRLNLPFADAYHASALLDRGLDQIISFDRHFDRIPGVSRIEP